MNRDRRHNSVSQRRVFLGAAWVARSGPFQAPAGAFVLLLALALGMLGLVEIALAFPLTGAMTLGFVACCALLFLPFLLVNRSRLKGAMALGFLGAVLAIHLIPWNSRKVFLNDLRSIKPGMSEDQVSGIMRRWATEYTARPRVDLQMDEEERLYVNRVDPRFQEDRGIVRFREGRVTGVIFMR